MSKGDIKLERAKRLYTGFKGTSTMGKVFNRIPDELIQGLTSKQIATVAEIVAKAYSDGRASTGCEMIDSNAVWINTLNRGIEWNEEGAEYKKKVKTEGIFTVVENVKVKDGVLVPRFIENQSKKLETK